MNDLTIGELQRRVDEWIVEHAGGYWGRFEILARLTEELGELSAAVQREEGLRPRKVAVDLEDELGDVLFTLAAFANASGIRLSEAIEKVLRKYRQRDGSAWEKEIKRKSSEK